MKKALLFLSLFVFTVAGYSQGEPEVSEIFLRQEAPIIWLGIDFTHVQIVGDLTDTEGGKEHTIEELKSTYFLNWNRMGTVERRKFNVSKMFRKDGMSINIRHINKVNKADSTTTHIKMVSSAKEFNIHVLEDILEDHVFDTVPETIGLMLIAERLDHTNKEAAFHFVAFSLESKNILINKRIVTHPNGIGLQEYWENAIVNVYGLITDQYYGNWKRQYFTK